MRDHVRHIKIDSYVSLVLRSAGLEADTERL